MQFPRKVISILSPLALVIALVWLSYAQTAPGKPKEIFLDADGNLIS